MVASGPLRVLKLLRTPYAQSPEKKKKDSRKFTVASLAGPVGV
jgi:hypothetical protein